jgi:hypothetical protein
MSRVITEFSGAREGFRPFGVREDVAMCIR